MLTHAELLALLRYDPDTGAFWRLRSLSNRTKVGDRADRLCARKQLFRAVMVAGQQHLAHRLAWFYMTGRWPNSLIDHRDLDATNNAWVNLREADKSKNAANIRAHRDNSTGLKGVSYDKRRDKFYTSIFVRGTKTHLGSFDCPAAASFAYQIASDQAFGEYSRVN